MRRGSLALALALWATALTVGFGRVWAYSVTPGAPAAAPLVWPVGTAIPQAVGLPTLVMFVHPECSCTAASLFELQVAVEATEAKLRTVVAIIGPGGGAVDWSATDAWKTARRVPGAEIRVDPDGRDAAKFGVATSGQVVLYDAAGQLVFAGGVTGSRGHEGDNLGRRLVAAIARGARPGDASTPVFGCPIDGGDRP